MDDSLLKELEIRRSFLIDTINEMTSFLRDVPRGQLKCMNKKKGPQYYWITEKGETNGKYIPKQNLDFAAVLAQKCYDQEILKQAKKELAEVETLIALLRSHALDRVYENASEARKALIDPIRLPDDEYVKQWKSRDYVKKGFGKDDPPYYTMNNERVRSKTEILIANMMARKNIPYLYEVPVTLIGFGTVYCDFGGLNVRKRKTIYLEHFGMMDDPEYCAKALRKINAYQNNGFFLGDNFIATFESRNQPLDMRSLERLLDHYFL